MPKNTGKHPGGRPTKYNDQTIPKTQFYLDNFEALGDKIPSIAGLADHLEVTRETVHDWLLQEEKAEFSYNVKRILQRQEKVLANKGLDGEFNSSITKLLLTKHGYSDKVEGTLGGPGGAPIPIQYIIQPVRPAQIESGEKEQEDGDEEEA